MAENPSQDVDHLGNNFFRKKRDSLLGKLASKRCDFKDELCMDLFEEENNPYSKYPPDYLSQVERVGVPPEMDDSSRDIKVMKHNEALAYYEKIVGRGKKSYGWFVDVEVFGAKATVNVVMACLLKELEVRCKQMGMDEMQLKSLSGYVVKGEFHDYGMAIDFDAQDNWLQPPKTTKCNLPMAMVLELQKMGFKWGMYFYKSRKDGKTDPMHFEYRGTIEDAVRQLKSPEAIQFATEYVLPKWKFNGQTLYEYAMRAGTKASDV